MDIARTHLVEIRAFRDLESSIPQKGLPFSFAGVDVAHAPLNPVDFEQGKWTPTPWPGCKCLGLSMDENEVMVLCQVEHPIDLGAHDHGEWPEELTMFQGELLERSTGRTFGAGRGVYYQPPFRSHWPEFLTPSIALIPWRREQVNPTLEKPIPQSITTKLPGAEWEDFANSNGACEWRRIACKPGRMVEFRTTAPFDFGTHSHDHTEFLTVVEGECDFKNGLHQRLIAGQSTLIAPGTAHSIATDGPGLAKCYWPTLEVDEITIKKG